MSDRTEPPASTAPAGRALLRRQSTLRERLECSVDEMHRRLEPVLHAADSVVDELSGRPWGAGPVVVSHATAAGLHTAPVAPQVPPSPSRATVTAAAKEKQEASLAHVGGSLIDPRRIMLQDKLAFVFGVVNVFLTAFWVGRWPQTYHYFWLVKDITLFSLRFLVYKQQGMHYMMLEYCYAANMVAFWYLFRNPQSAVLRRFSFAIMSGPLMWSIVAMRNSLVFHSGDKITTLMMHASPALSAWCMRWYPRHEWTEGMSPEQLAEWNSASWPEMALLPAVLNLAWVSIYYLVIFVLLNKRIQRRGYQNMFTAMVTRPSARKSALAKLVLSAPPRVQPLFYLFIHTFASWLSLLPTKLWFDHFWAHTAIVIFVILVATWNGASYYFRVFAKQLMKEQAERQAATSAGAERKAA
ncbi:hypothetical protein ABPG77_007687 [Micractinium sp. CCAP 211/92]